MQVTFFCIFDRLKIVLHNINFLRVNLQTYNNYTIIYHSSSFVFNQMNDKKIKGRLVYILKGKGYFEKLESILSLYLTFSFLLCEVWGPSHVASSSAKHIVERWPRPFSDVLRTWTGGPHVH